MPLCPCEQAELRRLFVMGLKPRTLATAARVALDAWEEACLQQQQAGAGAGELPAVPVTPAHLLVGLRPQLPASQVRAWRPGQVCAHAPRVVVAG